MSPIFVGSGCFSLALSIQTPSEGPCFSTAFPPKPSHGTSAIEVTTRHSYLPHEPGGSCYENCLLLVELGDWRHVISHLENFGTTLLTTVCVMAFPSLIYVLEL